MAKKSEELTARRVATVAEPGRHSDGGGLYLNVTPSGAKSWLFMWKTAGKRREMGLGPLSGVPLADARKKAADCRKLVAEGRDPIEERDAAKKAASVPTFAAMADEVVASLVEGFRNDKHRAQWKMTLEVYAEPLRNIPVDQVTTEDVLSCLKPIWTTKAETASRVRGRIERVLNAAKAKGYRSGENPAAWRGHLENLLPKRQKLTRGHHAAMDYADVPAFVAQLRERAATAALALEFVILTAARTGEMRGATWCEFDLERKLWIIPATRMKAGREHRVPLSDRAAEIVSTLARARTGDFVFPGADGKKPLSIMALDMLLRRMGVDVTVHGFRSSFRDWAGETTSFPREVIEHALAHQIPDKAEAAYARGTLLEKRRALMEAWAAHCAPNDAASNIIPFARDTAG